MKQQTAIDWLVNQINGHSHSIGLPYGMNIRIDIPDDIIQQAKAMEKEQIIDAFDSGLAYDYDDSETYYNKTYNNGDNN
jgi:hypothetical protein